MYVTLLPTGKTPVQSKLPVYFKHGSNDVPQYTAILPDQRIITFTLSKYDKGMAGAMVHTLKACTFPLAEGEQVDFLTDAEFKAISQKPVEMLAGLITHYVFE